MQFKLWLEGQRRDIANLQPDSVITVFHGTTHEYAYNFCLNGIDGKKFNQHRLYPHVSGGKGIKFGLFVAPNLQIAQKFGNVVLKFKSLGKNLIYKFPIEMRSQESDKYPHSFRPAVSQSMLDDSTEPQALYIGLLSPRAIEKVYVGQESMTTDEYLENYKSKKRKSLFEPQEYNMSLQDFVVKIAKDRNTSEDDILNTLKQVYNKYGKLTGIGEIPPTLLRRIENQLRKL